jgi:Peptidase C10 family
MRSILLILSLLLVSSAFATPVSVEDATTAANRLVEFRTAQDSWAGQPPSSVNLVRTLEWDGQPTGFYFEVEPAGCVLVAAFRELPPITAYSEQTRLTFDHAESAGTMFEQILQQKAATLSQYPDLQSMAAAGIDIAAVERYRAQWEVFTQPSHEAFNAESATRELDEYIPGTILMESAWHQEAPYNNFCPIDMTENCKVGCVATATAQIMNYWQWPPAGQGSHGYTWHSQTISANFGDPYDWDDILPEYGQPWEHSTDELNAIAELNFEVGVAYEMNYGVDGSGAFTSDVITILPQHFRYLEGIDEESRVAYPDDQAWFEMLCAELDQERPILYTIRNASWGHAIVADGYRIENDINEVHINYGGWVDIFLGWYAMDAIPFADWPDNEQAYRYIQPDGENADPDAVVITLEPMDYPFMLVPQGGSFTYDLTLETNLVQPMFGWVWAEPILPSGQPYGPIFSARVMFVPGMTLAVDDILQQVPIDAPLGYYQWWIHVGQNQGTPLFSSFFPFSVYAAGPDAISGGGGWTSQGHAQLGGTASDLPTDIIANLPTISHVEPACPNPFNASTVLTVSLNQSSLLQVTVVNTLGQEVGIVTSGEYGAGLHQFTFDAAELASGTYYVQTTVDSRVLDVQKIQLVR